MLLLISFLLFCTTIFTGQFPSENIINIHGDAQGNYAGWFMAVHEGHEKVVDMLVVNGMRSKINMQDKAGKTALMIAAARGHASLVDYLLKQGANASISDVYDNTAAMLSKKFNHNEIAKILLKREEFENKRANEKKEKSWALVSS